MASSFSLSIEKAVARRYAVALLACAPDAAGKARLHGDCGLFAKIMKSEARLQPFLGHPLVPQQGKGRVLERLGAEAGCSSIFRRFLAVVVRRRRAGQLAAILEAVDEIFAHSQGLRMIEIATAATLSDHGRATIVRTLQGIFGDGLRLSWQQDPHLIAGVRLRCGSRVLDASLGGDLQMIEQDMNRRISPWS